MSNNHASWLSDLVYPDQFQDKVQKVCGWIDELSPRPVAIAVRGISGAVFGGACSFVSGIPLIIVRKDNNSHSSRDVEYQDDQPDGSYVIVDDLISSGRTIEAIQAEIDASSDATLLLGGVVLYHQYDSDSCSNQTFIRELMGKVPVKFFA